MLSIFSHRLASKVCMATVATAAKRKHQEVRKLKVRLKVFLLTMILIMNTHLSSPKQAQHQVSMKLRKALILLALIQFFLFMKTISKSNQNVVLQWRKLRRQKMKVLCQSKLLKWLYLFLANTTLHSWSEGQWESGTICGNTFQWLSIRQI